MKKCLLSGIIVLAYGMSFAVSAAETATLTITGRVTAPTCSTDVVNDRLQQRCGNTTRSVSPSHITTQPVKGVLTEVIAVNHDPVRRIVVNRYD